MSHTRGTYRRFWPHRFFHPGRPQKHKDAQVPNPHQVELDTGIRWSRHWSRHAFRDIRLTAQRRTAIFHTKNYQTKNLWVKIPKSLRSEVRRRAKKIHLLCLRIRLTQAPNLEILSLTIGRTLDIYIYIYTHIHTHLCRHIHIYIYIYMYISARLEVRQSFHDKFAVSIIIIIINDITIIITYIIDYYYYYFYYYYYYYCYYYCYYYYYYYYYYSMISLPCLTGRNPLAIRSIVIVAVVIVVIIAVAIIVAIVIIATVIIIVMIIVIAEELLIVKWDPCRVPPFLPPSPRQPRGSYYCDIMLIC